MQLYVVGYKDMDFFLKYQEFLHFFAKRDFVTGYCAKITWLIMGSRNHRDSLLTLPAPQQGRCSTDVTRNRR